MTRAIGAVAVSIALLATVAPADGAVTLAPGANTVTTPMLELDFGDNAGNVERVDGIRWRDGTGSLSPNLAASGGSPAPACSSGEPLETWGQAFGDSNLQPILVAPGATGTWTTRGGRTIELSSSVPTSCSGDGEVTAVRTRYSFFDDPFFGNMVRVERRFGFGAGSASYPNTLGLRAYVPRMPGVYSQVVHPNSTGSALVTNNTCGEGCLETNWNGSWFAVNDPATNRGVVVLRDPANLSPARLILDNDALSGSNSSSATLTKPAGGWKAPLTETLYLCFYDTSTWGVASRGPTQIPNGCGVLTVPVPTAPPAISGTPQRTSQVTASTGAWDYGPDEYSYQWARCDAAGCSTIFGATGQTYTAADDDVGRRLRVTVTATKRYGGLAETDSIASAQSAVVAPAVPSNLSPPFISGTFSPGRTLTADPGGWTDSPTSYTYAWRRCNTAGAGCADIPGATGRTYAVTSADTGRGLRVRVVASNATGASAPAESAPIVGGVPAPTNTRAPGVVAPRDPPRVGDPLSADTGSWDGEPTSFDVQWRRCDSFGANCADIPGAVENTYTLDEADLERTLRVRVVALNAGGGSAPAESEPSRFVRPGTLTARLRVFPSPSCAGVETFLDASESTGPHPIVRYQFFYRNVRPDPAELAELTIFRYVELGEGAGGAAVILGDGTAPGARKVFPWNAGIDLAEFQARIDLLRGRGSSTAELVRGFENVLAQELANPTLYRRDATLILIATDLSGATARIEQRLTFAQGNSQAPRTGCPVPLSFQLDNTLRRATDSLRASNDAVTTVVPCPGPIDCIGQLAITRITGFARTSGRRRARPSVSAFTSFTVPAGKRKRVRARLSRTARATLRRRGRVRAQVRLTMLRPSGKAESRTRTVTLRAPRRR